MSIFNKTHKHYDYGINQYSSGLKALNDDLHVEERRYRSRLKATAGGIMMLGLWAVIQTLIWALTSGDFNEIEGDITPFAKALIITFFIFIFSGIVLSFRFIILRGAKREADYGIKKNGYLGVAVYLMLVGLYSFGFFIYRAFGDKDLEANDVITVILDMTAFVLLLELFIYAKKLRKIRAEIAENEKSEGA